MTTAMQFRPDTDDAGNFGAIVVRNEYQLPARFPAGALVLDVGAHIGCFAYAAILRGAGKVVSFEPEAGNFAQLTLNLSPCVAAGQAEIHNLAVWRSDGRGPDRLHFRPSENPRCTGGGNVLWAQNGQDVWTLPLDTALVRATEPQRSDRSDQSDGSDVRVHTLKLDCEGSEWPILLTARRLDLVDRIVGEYHEIGGRHMDRVRLDQAHRTTIPDCARVDGYSQYTAAELSGVLSGQGFLVQIVPSAVGWLGHFFAERR